MEELILVKNKDIGNIKDKLIEAIINVEGGVQGDFDILELIRENVTDAIRILDKYRR